MPKSAFGRSIKEPGMLCPVCKKAIQQSFAVVAAGAIFLEDSENGGPHDQMEAHFNFVMHGGHPPPGQPERNAIVHLGEEDQERGQIEIYFCSTQCLRDFLNSRVDELEARFKAAK